MRHTIPNGFPGHGVLNASYTDHKSVGRICGPYVHQCGSRLFFTRRRRPLTHHDGLARPLRVKIGSLPGLGVREHEVFSIERDPVVLTWGEEDKGFEGRL